MTNPSSIYLDGHATTPLAPEAAQAMSPWWHDTAANAHSPHGRGRAASVAVEESRRAVADLAGVGPGELKFTSGATEANNLALLGIAQAAIRQGDPRRRIVISAIEHSSVSAPARALAEMGYEIAHLSVTADGIVDVASLEHIDADTLLVAVMAANNEVGAIQPLDLVAERARAVGALVHVDAAQAFGKIPLDLAMFDTASLSSHKCYGPQGVGALFVSAACAYRPAPLVHGGSQEGGLRSGTLPVPLIVGFGRAARLAQEVMSADARHAGELVERFLGGLHSRRVRYVINGSRQHTLPGSISVQFPDVDVASLIDELSEEVCFSDGSACTSGSPHYSHVLEAMGLGVKEMRSTARFFFSRYNTTQDADLSASLIAAAIGKVAA